MGKSRKRGHSDHEDRRHRKRRRKDKESRQSRRRSPSPRHNWESEDSEHNRDRARSPTPLSWDSSSPRYWSDSEAETSPPHEDRTPRSEVHKNENIIIDLDTDETAALPNDILEALGDPKSRDEIFGPPIPVELARRWETILKDGLVKELKQEIIDRTLIPENFRLAKAPLLNEEIIPALSDSVRNRDKLLEKSQNLLGLGIAKLTQVTASIITANDLNKVDVIKNLSQVSQVLLELHHEETISRRKLIMASLDKKFTMTIKDVKRDEYLFGANLGTKIKALKTAEKSGLQIKRQDTSANPKRNLRNWRGSTRSAGLGQRGRKYQRGRQSTSYQSQRGAANTRPPRGGSSRKPNMDKPDKS